MLLFWMACTTVESPSPAPAPALELRPQVAELPANALELELLLPEPDAPGSLAMRVEGAGIEGDGIAAERWQGDVRSLALARSVQLELDPLPEGGSYALVVQAGAEGPEQLRHRFSVVPADHQPPQAADLRPGPAPAAGGREPLRLGFGEPVQHRSLEALTVLVGGSSLAGSWELDPPQRVASFTPNAPWPEGPRYLSLGFGVQDLAGNPMQGRPRSPMPLP